MKCTFCDKIISQGKGLISVKSDGTINYFCDSKCERNAKIRMSKNVRWTETYRKRKVLRAAEETAQKKNKE